MKTTRLVNILDLIMRFDWLVYAGVVVLAITLSAVGAYAQTSDRWIYDARGNHVGTVARDNAGNTSTYDSRGNKVGSSSPTGSGGRNYYDSRGNKTGSSSRN